MKSFKKFALSVLAIFTFVSNTCNVFSAIRSADQNPQAHADSPGAGSTGG